MSKLEEVIETIKAKASACGTTQSGRARKGAYVDCIMLLKYLTSSHREEIEALERKAWECSVEMMDESFKNSEMAEDPKCTRKDKYNGLASAWKYAAYKLREVFDFPKSETPDRFKK